MYWKFLAPKIKKLLPLQRGKVLKENRVRFVEKIKKKSKINKNLVRLFSSALPLDPATTYGNGQRCIIARI